MLFLIIAVIAIIALIIFGSSVKRKKDFHTTIVAKDKTTFSSHQVSLQKKSTTILCNTCHGSRKVKCRFCHGFGTTKTTKFIPPSTIQVSRVRPIFDSKGKASYQHYNETQTKPGRTEYINQPCGYCFGSGKVKCPDCQS